MAPCSAYTFHRVLPAVPRLVVIAITPLAASVPYRADADGPFTTSMEAISSGERSLTRLGGAHPTSHTDEERRWLGRLPDPREPARCCNVPRRSSARSVTCQR